MRIKLVTPITGATSEPESAAPPQTTETAPSAQPRPQARSQRILATVTSWTVAVPTVLVCLVVLGGSLFLRLPDNQRLLKAQARELKPIEPIEKPVSAEQLAQLQVRAGQASASLSHLSGEIASLLFDLDARARKLGWRVEVSVKPIVPAPSGFKELTLHPVFVQLDDAADLPEPPYQRLLTWLRHVSTLSKRAEVVACRLRSAGAGLVSAEVELNLFSLNPNEETAAK